MEKKTRHELESMSFIEWMKYDAAQVIADQEARPRKWQDEWYKRGYKDCMAKPPDEVMHIGECREPKNHEGPHVGYNFWMKFTWEPME